MKLTREMFEVWLVHSLGLCVQYNSTKNSNALLLENLHCFECG